MSTSVAEGSGGMVMIFRLAPALLFPGSTFMKVVGIIAEYNPFHKGHQFHLSRARELTGADYVIVVMLSLIHI